MLSENDVLKYFWVYVLSTTFFVSNRMLITFISKFIPYEIFKERQQNISHLRIFGNKCFVINNGK